MSITVSCRWRSLLNLCLPCYLVRIAQSCFGVMKMSPLIWLKHFDYKHLKIYVLTWCLHGWTGNTILLLYIISILNFCRYGSEVKARLESIEDKSWIAWLLIGSFLWELGWCETQMWSLSTSLDAGFTISPSAGINTQWLWRPRAVRSLAVRRIADLASCTCPGFFSGPFQLAY